MTGLYLTYQSAVLVVLGLVVIFGLGVMAGTKAGFIAGMYHAIDQTQDAIEAHSKLYNTMINLNDDEVLIVKLVKRKKDENA